MTDVYYTLDEYTCEELLSSILKNYYDVKEIIISHNRNGKPKLENCPIEFSIARSDKMTIIAVSQKPVGVDCEKVVKKDYSSELKLFPKSERELIKTEEDFYHSWTAKESFIKFKGTKTSKMIRQLEYIDGRIRYKKQRQKVLIVKNVVDDYIMSICVENPGVNIIKLNKVALRQNDEKVG